jgi:hypothetical protein
MEINYITKKRAYRYVAAAEKEWLYPERYLPTTHWNKLGSSVDAPWRSKGFLTC